MANISASERLNSYIFLTFLFLTIQVLAAAVLLPGRSIAQIASKVFKRRLMALLYLTIGPYGCNFNLNPGRTLNYSKKGISHGKRT